MVTPAIVAYSHVTKDPEMCGGRACVDGTRIRVMDIVSLERRAMSPEQMLQAYPSLNLAQVHAALSYYYEHPGEIMAAFAEDERTGEKIESDRADSLKKHPALQ